MSAATDAKEYQLSYDTSAVQGEALRRTGIRQPSKDVP